MEDEFTAQAQHFVRLVVFGAVTLGLAVSDVNCDLRFRLLLRSCVFVRSLS